MTSSCVGTFMSQPVERAKDLIMHTEDDDLSCSILRVCWVQFPMTKSLNEKQTIWNFETAADTIRWKQKAQLKDGSNKAIDLFLFPELCPLGYSDETFWAGDTDSVFERLDELQTQSSKTFEIMRQAAIETNSYVWYGIATFEFDMNQSDQSKRISHVIIDNEGLLVDVYHKIHVCDYGDCSETDQGFEGGDELCIFQVDKYKMSLAQKQQTTRNLMTDCSQQTDNDIQSKFNFKFNVGLIICADMRPPELTRAMCSQNRDPSASTSLGGGLDLMLHPCAFSRDVSFHSYHQFVTTRAIENQIYWLSCNYAGENFGASIFAKPMIDEGDKYGGVQTLDNGDETSFLIGEVKKGVLHKARDEFKFKDRGRGFNYKFKKK